MQFCKVQQILWCLDEKKRSVLSGCDTVSEMPHQRARGVLAPCRGTAPPSPPLSLGIKKRFGSPCSLHLED